MALGVLNFLIMFCPLLLNSSMLRLCPVHQLTKNQQIPPLAKPPPQAQGFSNPPTLPPPREALKKFLKAKEEAGFRKPYITSLRQIITSFINFDTSFDTKGVTDFLESRNWGAAAKRGNIGRLASFFTYCVKQQWLENNPCDSIEMPKVADKIPFTWTAEQKDLILNWTLKHKPKMLALVTLEVVMGVRPAETQKVGWKTDKTSNRDSYVDIGAARRVVIDSAASKVWKRRTMPISDEAMKWFELARDNKATLPVPKSNRKRFIKDLRAVLGFKAWPQDSLRHTAATNTLREVEDVGKVARWFGNSEKIMLKNYADI